MTRPDLTRRSIPNAPDKDAVALKTYRLVPSPPGQHWGLLRQSGEVKIRARSSGEARAIAAAQEASMLGMPARSNSRASAFLDPKLYSVRLVQSAQI
jgi:hypothetical protein